ncbi:hypothetical protein E2C01_012868 [Portunus trituberculatus]|uniref:Uncharacterized protein n=1 Tax=Portunus trituberculatus TaxID=210409 RepID=A0A5B7DF58_PORTR|nr:hypothetical protein [Portunus trituberculatus]
MREEEEEEEEEKELLKVSVKTGRKWSRLISLHHGQRCPVCHLSAAGLLCHHHDRPRSEQQRPFCQNTLLQDCRLGDDSCLKPDPVGVRVGLRRWLGCCHLPVRCRGAAAVRPRGGGDLLQGEDHHSCRERLQGLSDPDIGMKQRPCSSPVSRAAHGDRLSLTPQRLEEWMQHERVECVA